MKGKKNELLNENIKFPILKVIDEQGNLMGDLKLQDALKAAKEKNLDLLVVSADAKPPVAKFIDYVRHLFDLKKKRKNAIKTQKKQELKEIQILLGIQKHDYEVKLNRAKSFLGDRDKVRIVLKLRGREMSCLDLVHTMFQRIRDDLKDHAVCDESASSKIEANKKIHFLVFDAKK